MARRPTRPNAQLARRRETKIAFDAMAIEGALLQPELVTRIATSEPTQQLAADYGLDPGEKLREVVQTKFTQGQSLHARFSRSDKGAAALKRFLTSLLTEVFEFKDLVETTPVSLDGRIFPIGHQALAGAVPIVFAPYEAIDRGDKAFGDTGRQRAPAQLLQEYLNAAAGKALWGLAADGRALRLYRANPAMTRPAYIEADLAAIFDSDAPRLPDFSALWLLIHASRFGKTGTPPTDCPLERWREEGREKGARAREVLRKGVEQAIKSLGQGFLARSTNAKLKDDLAKGVLSPQGYLDALLRLVYRLIFVFAAEDRDLLHLPRPQDTAAYETWRAARDVYRRGYGLARLRELSSKRHAHDRNIDGWEGTKILFRELWHGQPKLALPALGGLFASGHVRDFANCQLANQHFYAAIFNLAWLRTESGLERVNWRDMETEELGSVYESLLELTPDLSGPLNFDFIEVAGHERKTTASYYTPDSLVQALLDETLDPLIAERTRGKEGKAAIDALLDLRIIDPACGSAHFLLAAARRLAVRCAQFDKPGEAPSPADFRHWLREVARRTLFGVDKNPMAIELAKVALWIETVEPGKPLSFLDSHLRCGDSLFGLYDLAALQRGIPDEAYKPLAGDVKKAAAEWRKRNRAEREARKQGELSFFEPSREVLEAARALEAVPEDELAVVEAKSEKFRALLAGPDRHRMEAACDLYVAAFVLPKTEGPVRTVGAAGTFVPTSRDVWDKLAGGPPLGLIEARAIDAAKTASAFHWPLEFPQVFFPGTGRRPGFDVALGNPPWDRIKLQEQEFFAARDPDIASAPTAAAREAMIETLAEAEVGSARWALFQTFIVAKRIAESASAFAHIAREAGGRFPLTGTGDVNTYALFAELFATAAACAGVIVPRGLSTDATTAPFFSSLVTGGRLRALCCFENEAFIFPAVHHSFQFAILALGPPDSSPAKFRQFIRYFHQLREVERTYSLTARDIAAINPNTSTAPIFRTKVDADLTKLIYTRVPVLIDKSKGKEGNPWGIEFVSLFHMSNDSGLFRTAKQLSAGGFSQDGCNWVNANGGNRYLPLYEAKMIDLYDHRAGSYKSRGDERGFRVLPETTREEHANPEFEITPYYWIAQSEVTGRLAKKNWKCGWLMGWKDVTSAISTRTVIGTPFPVCGVGNSLPVWFADSKVEPAHIVCLLAMLSSLPLDFTARFKVGGNHLNFFIAEQLPILPPSVFTEIDINFLAPRVLELTYTSHSMKPFAKDLGYTDSPFPWDEDRRGLLRAEVDAKIAKLYGLTRDQLRYVLDPADIYGPTYPSETFRVLKKNEIAEYGEYRTARLVLDAWDRMERGELTS